ncbi:hypothetical protein L873DRAFT_1821954 [Choiromyces venosus 120613-1]|uniref:Extracellular membrane protein CFEM domain-containing protein n=1 Tax=Choiromyces venosus 120613-1 TaxID=1336337 RepID=A0A3N4IUV5_9PEZI|nr:hypothetical protein L873DRAFT_1821954 [Choiromyces venosus 120613-1]
MMELQFKLAAGILCLVSVISSLTSGAGVTLQPRDVDVDFSGMPQCSSKICIPTLGSSLGCGSRILVDCFCGKPNPLMCAWTVNWDCWNRTEDWYATQCPGKPLIDLTGIPSCARGCFDKSNVCMEFTSNCVCSEPRPDCSASTTSCNSSEAAVYDAWYTKSCEYNQTATNPTSTQGSSSTSSTSTSSPTTTPIGSGSGSGGGGGGLSKGATVGLAIGAFTGTVGLGALIFFFFFRKSKGAGQDYSAAPTGPQELEDPSLPKIRSELMSSEVYAVPPVEAPGGDHTRPVSEIYTPFERTRPASELFSPVSLAGQGRFDRGFYEPR